MISAAALARRWLPAPRPIPAQFSAQLDCLRWVAAFLVCITHVRSLVLADYQPGSTSSWLVRAFYFAHGFGHEAVMIFFILSGYLVGGEVLRNLHQGGFDWRAYLVRRLTRLYPAYLAAIILGGVMDHVGWRFLADTGLYTQAVDSPMIFYNASTRLGLDTLLGNLIFCQGLLVPTYGSNVPLWSLANEAWYYLIFPLAGGLLFVTSPPWKKLATAALLAAAVWFVRGQILLYFSIWLLGLVPHFLRRPIFRPVLPLLLAAAACMVLVRLRLTPTVPVLLWHIALGVTLVLLINALEHTTHPVPGPARWHRFLAGFSFSQYLLHWPVAVLGCALIRHYFGYGLRENLTAASLLYYLALLLTIYLVAWLVAHFTEHRTAALRTRLLPPRATPAAA